MANTKREELNKAYLDTNYVADCEGTRVLIRIGEIPESLDPILNLKNQDYWTFITAYNPYSQELTEKENKARQAALKARLSENNWIHFDGYGEAPNGEWPPEPSLLVLGIARTDAINLATEFQQNAIVCGRKKAIAELVWCM